MAAFLACGLPQLSLRNSSLGEMASLVWCGRLAESRRLDELMRIRRLTAMDDMEKGAHTSYRGTCSPSQFDLVALALLPLVAGNVGQ